MNELERWSNFYILTSAASATLIGLLFVVITLAASSGQDSTKIRVYLTPNFIYFASVLFIAALLTVPNHNRLSITVCICLLSIVGIVYTGPLFFRRSVKISYNALLDRIPYAGFPLAAYGILLIGGVLVLQRPQFGLTLIAASMLSLLAVAIRNSWSTVTYLVSKSSGSQ
jgi:hypothetical protein